LNVNVFYKQAALGGAIKAYGNKLKELLFGIKNEYLFRYHQSAC